MLSMRAPFVLAALLLTAGTLAAAGEGAKPPDPNAPNAKTSGTKPAKQRVFTNKDLEKYKSASRPGVVVVDMNTLQGPKADAPDPNDTGIPTAAEKEQRLRELRNQIQSLEAQIAALDQRLKSNSNPFLPRPALSEEEKRAQAGMDGRQIQAKIEADRAEVTAKLAAARAEMEKLIATPVRPANVVPSATAAPDAVPPSP
jgi:exonuclease VII small subunit